MSHLSVFLGLQNLPATGESLAKLISRLIDGNRIVDLLYHQPSCVARKNFLPSLYQIKNKEIIIAKIKVEAHIKPKKIGQPFRVRCFCESGYLTLIFFKTFLGYIEKHLAIGSEIVVSGIAERFNDELQISHPEYVLPAAAIDKIPKVEVVYPLVNGLNQKLVRNRIAFAFDKITALPEWINNDLLKQQNWQSWKDSIFALHHPPKQSLSPKTSASLPQDKITFEGFGEVQNKARKRLAFDELLASQIANSITKKYLINKKGRALTKGNILRDQLIDNLPFLLTKGQKQVLAEIDQDLLSDKQMLRLLQGDVGSGKTIVAFLAMLLAIENKRQATIICPITLLAIQHHKNLQIMAEKIGIKIALLTSKTTKKNKQKILEDLKNGKINILIGTHSLLEPDIIFEDLALIVIDEQHRFGVIQRIKLVEKGNQADVLLMSATPIPRSLMMTFYGDMKISVLNEKPQNRIKIDTRVISQNKEKEVVQAICRAIKSGEKIYWICPLIDEQELNEEDMAEKNDLGNVSARYEQFCKEFGQEKVGLIHGKMKEKEKEQIMTKFAQEEMQILVATTVIEVGIDVADATIIIIENCENFGLSQLHQLRGRVGRGDKKSYCILLYGKKLGNNGKKRLAIMKDSNDGFFIAEEDLKIRGGGKKLGTKQSGLPEYKIANLNYDLDLLNIANRYSKYLLESSKTIDQEPLKVLLKIFKYDECIKLISGG
jgi:ATP-dependent DNA helicase RecG